MEEKEQFKIQREPCCLIGLTDDGRLYVDGDVLKELQHLTGPLMTLAITGTARSGKSYLLNRIAGRCNGFQVGPSTSMKGIWIWVRPHPQVERASLVLLDTEGIQDTDKATEEDFKLLSLAAALSSKMIYNIKGDIDEEMNNMMNALSQAMQMFHRKRGNTLQQILYNFPELNVVIRDFCWKDYGLCVQITPIEYLDRLLQTRTDKDASYNRARAITKLSFQRRNCYMIDTPMKSIFAQMDPSKLTEEELPESFRIKMDDLCQQLCEYKPMLNCSGQEVNGESYTTLVKEFVKVLEDGVIPFVESSREIQKKKDTKEFKEDSRSYMTNKEKWLPSSADERALFQKHNEIEIPENHMKLAKDCLRRSKKIELGTDQQITSDKKEMQMRKQSSLRRPMSMHEQLGTNAQEQIKKEIMRQRAIDEEALKQQGQKLKKHIQNELENEYKTTINNLASENMRMKLELLVCKEMEKDNKTTIDKLTQENTQIKMELEAMENSIQREKQELESKYQAEQASLEEQFLNRVAIKVEEATSEMMTQHKATVDRLTIQRAEVEKELKTLNDTLVKVEENLEQMNVDKEKQSRWFAKHRKDDQRVIEYLRSELFDKVRPSIEKKTASWKPSRSKQEGEKMTMQRSSPEKKNKSTWYKS